MEQPPTQSSSSRSTLIIVVVAVAALAMVCAFGLILVSAGGAFFLFQNSSPLASAQTLAVTPPANSDGSAIGNPNAKVVVMMFEDFQCPICKRFDTDIKPQIFAKYVDTGKVRVDFRHLIVIDGNVGGTESHDAAIASECAGEQGWFWPYHDLLFANQTGEGVGDFKPSNLKAFASSLKLDRKKFDSCFDSQKYQSILDADLTAAIQIKASGTPTVYIKGQPPIGGIPRDGMVTYEKVIEAALAAAGVK